MESGEIPIICIDSCIFLEIILEQPRCEKCRDYLNNLVSKKDNICTTPIVVQEVMRILFKEVGKRNDDRDFARSDMQNLYQRKGMDRFLSVFGQFMQGMFIIFPKTANFNTIHETCNHRLHLEEPNDILNISIAIDNNCTAFATLEEDIFNDKNTIKKITSNSLKVQYIKKR